MLQICVKHSSDGQTSMCRIYANIYSHLSLSEGQRDYGQNKRVSHNDNGHRTICHPHRPVMETVDKLKWQCFPKGLNNTFISIFLIDYMETKGNSSSTGPPWRVQLILGTWMPQSYPSLSKQVLERTVAVRCQWCNFNTYITVYKCLLLLFHASVRNLQIPKDNKLLLYNKYDPPIFKLWVLRLVIQHQKTLIPLISSSLSSFWCYPPDSSCHL